VKLLTGPIAGKEFILYRIPRGSAPRPSARSTSSRTRTWCRGTPAIQSRGEHYELEDQGSPRERRSGLPVARRRLRSRDQIQVWQTTMEFRLKHD
jgi:hypothetical protein